MKILFLDVDGVMNSEETLRKSNLVRDPHPCGIDPYLALLVNRIIEATGCIVVLSSAWRGSEENHKYIERMIGTKLHDITGHCRCRLRGAEIYDWIQMNVSYEERKEGGPFRYAILDDDSDMLLWQKDHFFKTSWKIGITEEISKAVIEHLNK